LLNVDLCWSGNPQQNKTQYIRSYPLKRDSVIDAARTNVCSMSDMYEGMNKEETRKKTAVSEVGALRFDRSA